MEGFLLYYKKYSKLQPDKSSTSNTTKLRCSLVVNEKALANSEFLIFNSKKANRIDRRIPFFAIERLSQYNDMSWEFETRDNKYRFKALDPEDNARWYEKMNKLFNHNKSRPSRHSSLGSKRPSIAIMNSNNRDQSIQRQTAKIERDELTVLPSNDESIYEMRVIPTLTNPHLMHNFSLLDTYQIGVEFNGISLRNLYDPREYHFFNAITIRKYGATSYCFAFELGRISNYGEGILALESVRYPKSRLIYAHINDLVERAFYNLLIQLDGVNRIPIRDQERDLHVKHIRIRSNSPPPILTAAASNQSHHNHHPVSIPINNQLRQNHYYNFNSPPQALSPRKTNIEIRTHVDPTPDQIDQPFQVYKAIVINKSDEYAPPVNYNRQSVLRNDPKSGIELNVVNNTAYPGCKYVITHNDVINLKNPQYDYYHHHHDVDNEIDDSCHLPRTEYDPRDDEFSESESFYEEKYVPQYMSTKNLVSPPLEYFVEDDNAIYGRVQL